VAAAVAVYGRKYKIASPLRRRSMDIMIIFYGVMSAAAAAVAALPLCLYTVER